MGEEICTVCKDDDNICDNDGNFSSGLKNGQTIIHPQFSSQKFINNNINKEEEEEKNITGGNINNGNTNIIYDNPLCNISLNESMNLGTCYIGTSNNNTKLKPYKPEKSLKSFMTKNRITLDSSNFNNSIYKNNESPLNRRINLTTTDIRRKKCTQKKKIFLKSNYQDRLIGS